MNWTIDDIDGLTQEQAAGMALEHLTVKDHDVYLVDFGGYFKYSYLVYFNGSHIRYANDYELHHPGKTREQLRAYYLEQLPNKLFTDVELVGDLANYDEYQAKSQYLRDYYPLRRPYISAFCIGEKEQKRRQKQVQGMTYDPVCFAYFDDAEFVARHIKLLGDLEAAKDRMNASPEYWRQAFLREMYNHEYGINWQADYDTLSAFGNIR